RDGWNVHEATRLTIRAKLSREQPERFRFLSARAAVCFPGDEPHLVIETIFHRLVADANAGGEQLYGVWMRWEKAGWHQSLQALGLMLREILDLPTLAELPRGLATVCLGWIMRERLSQREIQTLAHKAFVLLRRQGHP